MTSQEHLILQNTTNLKNQINVSLNNHSWSTQETKGKGE